jgi:hypothetical protein
MNCGFFGTFSLIWVKLTGKYPPFEQCCIEHDLAYDQIENEEDRYWADQHFKRCMEIYYDKNMSWLTYVMIRIFGRLTWLIKFFER